MNAFTSPKARTRGAGAAASSLALAVVLVVPALAVAGTLPATCAPGSVSACDDGDPCTGGDHCSAGLCVGSPSVIPAACAWGVVDGGTGARARASAGSRSTVVGAICGNALRLQDASSVQGDIVSTASSGRGASFGAAAVVNGDIVTGGAAIRSSSPTVQLPGLAASLVPGGSMDWQADDPSCELDARGGNPLVDDCRDAIAGIPASARLLDSTAFRSGGDHGNVTVDAGTGLTLYATARTNVVDFGTLDLGNSSTITLDGAGIPGVVFLVRVDRDFSVHFGSGIVLKGGAAPERVIFYVRGRCRIGEFVSAAGTLFCPYDRITVGQHTYWEGALVAGGGRLDLGVYVQVNHAPLQVFVP